MNLQQQVVSSISSSVEPLILTEPTKSGSSLTSAGWQTKSVHRLSSSWPVTTRVLDTPALRRTQEKLSSSRFVVFRCHSQTKPVWEDLTPVAGIVVVTSGAPISPRKRKPNKLSLISRKVQASCQRASVRSVDFHKREMKLARAGSFNIAELLIWALICTETLATWGSPPSLDHLRQRRTTFLRSRASPKCHYE